MFFTYFDVTLLLLFVMQSEFIFGLPLLPCQNMKCVCVCVCVCGVNEWTEYFIEHRVYFLSLVSWLFG